MTPLLDRAFWAAPAEWPKGNSEWTFLADALLVVGRGLFGDEWSGREPRAFRSDEQSAYRLKAAMEWIAARARDNELSVAAQLEDRLEVRLITLPIWNIPDVSKRFRRCRFYPSAPMPGYDMDRQWAHIYLGKAGLDAEIEGMPHSKLAVSQLELGGYSPYLQYAVMLARRWDLVSSTRMGREEMLANIHEAWRRDRPDEDLSDLTAKAIRQLLRFPNSDAIKRGSSRKNSEKNG